MYSAVEKKHEENIISSLKYKDIEYGTQSSISRVIINGFDQFNEIVKLDVFEFLGPMKHVDPEDRKDSNRNFYSKGKKIGRNLFE